MDALDSRIQTRSQSKLAKNTSPTSSKWLKEFQGMTKFEQMSALESLVGACLPTQLRHLQCLVEPLLQKDFISLLPREISTYIISLLSPNDMVSAAKTCRYWRALCEDNFLWKQKCNEAGIKQGMTPNLARRHYWEQITRQNEDPDMPTYESSKPTEVQLFDSKNNNCFERARWKAIYLRHQRIRQNWFSNNPTSQVNLPHGAQPHDEHVITGLQINGDIIATASDDQTVRIWSATTARCLHSLHGHSGGVWTLLLSEDGSRAISGSTDRTIRIWDTKDGKLIHTLQGHTSTVRCLSIHGDILVSGSRDCTLRIWNIQTGLLLQVLYAHLAAVRCVQFDGKRIVSGSYDFKIAVFDANTYVRKHLLAGHTDRLDGSRDLIISGSLDTTIRIWNCETGLLIHKLLGHQSLTSGMQLRGNTLGKFKTLFKFLLTPIQQLRQIWNITEGTCVHTLSGPNRHLSAVTSLQFIYDDLVATSSDDGTVKLWDVKNGAFVCNLVKLSHDQRAGGCIWRLKATGTMLVCAVGSRNGIEDTKLVLLDFDSSYP
ncbi:F-box domain-containing protein [Aphelenchoides bicaudatus]|nr:F-box domain-containing protein [Aphelenchoides bicaudatus]